MKKRFSVLMVFLLSGFTIHAMDTVYVKEARVPILLDRSDNVLFYVKVDSKGNDVFESLTLELGSEVDLTQIDRLKLYYSGSEAYRAISPLRFAPVEYISSHRVGATRAANPSYSRLMSEVSVKKKKVVLKADQRLFPGVNYLWVSIKMKPDASVITKVSAKIVSVEINKKDALLAYVSPKGIEHRMGVGVRQAGDDGSAAFRIPGLVTTNRGTLLGVYDVRYNSSVDLQERIDIGLSRSTDGGQTWEKMRLPLAYGEYGGLPSAQNGVGDPAILVDVKTNTVWAIAIWTHGMGNGRAWFNSLPGNSLEETAQLVLSKSMDDGKTWSDPINITNMVKDPSWRLLLQGPGSGITMSDGTLVFPIQYKDSTDMPQAGIMYSKDRGDSWKITSPARINTTEAQVAELPDGSLMLNMRDNRGGSRAVAITEDLGVTWEDHPSSRRALVESVCQASLISVKAKDNVLDRDLLIFSNPNVTKGRYNTTIKISLDNGLTWSVENQVLLDEGNNWGYSCLTMIDRQTVGILYESSVAHMTFQAVKLTDIVR